MEHQASLFPPLPENICAHPSSGTTRRSSTQRFSSLPCSLPLGARSTRSTRTKTSTNWAAYLSQATCCCTFNLAFHAILLSYAMRLHMPYISCLATLYWSTTGHQRSAFFPLWYSQIMNEEEMNEEERLYSGPSPRTLRWQFQNEKV